MADIDLKTETPDTSLPTTGFLFGADSQAASAPSVFTTQAVATTLLGSTTLSGATITADAPVLNMSQTWNNAAVTFTGLKFNATDTASNAASLLLDLQTGGTSRFNLTKAGTLMFAGNLQIANNGVYIEGTAVGTVRVPGAGGYYGFTTNSASSSASTIDTFVTRRGAANLRFGAADAAAPVAQTLSVQSVVAGTTNTAGANLTITGSQGTGTGAGGSIIFQVAPAGGTGTAQNGLATALTIDGTGTNATFAQRASFGASTVFVERESSARLQISVAGNAFGFSNSSFSLDSGASMGFRSASGITAALDVFLYRDAANTLALRNGTNAQESRIYGTFTDTSNYRRVASGMSTAGVGFIRPEGAGTGASGNVIHISGLPTSNPGPGILWNNAGTPAIGT